MNAISEDTSDIRLVRNGEQGSPMVAYHRTPAQKHTDTGFDNTIGQALEAATSFGESLEWAASIGVEIPSRIKGVVTILGQWQTYLADQRKLRG